MKILKTSHKGYMQFVVLNRENQIIFKYKNDLDLMERVRYVTDNRHMTNSSRYKVYRMNRVCTYINMYRIMIDKLKEILWK